MTHYKHNTTGEVFGFIPDGCVVGTGANDVTIIDNIKDAELAVTAYKDSQLTLDDIKAKKLLSLRDSYNEEITSNVTYMNTTFQADEYSQSLLAKCLSAGTVPNDFYWLDVSNTKIPMTFDALQGLSSAILIRGQRSFDNLQTKKAAVKIAGNPTDVEAVTWV